MGSKLSFPFFFGAFLVCLLSGGVASHVVAQEKPEAVLLINGKKMEKGSQIKIAEIGKTLEIKAFSEKGLEIIVYLVRGRRPMKVQKFKSSTDFKNFDFGAWVKNQSQLGKIETEEGEKPRFDIARPDDRLVFEILWEGGGSVHSVGLL